jgi:tRNA(Arg) A34 adenosine deaminase TadA
MNKKIKLSKIEPVRKVMLAAIRQAIKSQENGDYPIGAALYNIKTKQILLGHNYTKLKDDSTRHAEIELIREAVSKQSGPYLSDWVLYTTHEPCPMCSGAAVWAKVAGIVFALPMEEMADRTNDNAHYRWRMIKVKCSNVIKDTKIRLIENYLYAKASKLWDR